jgi:hypothetical protein
MLEHALAPKPTIATTAKRPQIFDIPSAIPKAS